MLCFVTTQDFFVGDISKQQLCCYSTLGKDILTPLYFFSQMAAFNISHDFFLYPGVLARASRISP